MKFRVILADPPWVYADPELVKGAGLASGNAGYQSMDLDALCRLDVGQVCAEDCTLFLWTTGPHLADAAPHSLMRAWGFNPRTLVFTWVKLYPRNGAPVQGPGRYSMSSCEYVMLGVRGHPHRVGRDVPSEMEEPIRTPRGAHSEKPVEVHRRVERLMGDVPRLEMFARARRPGWLCIGNALTGRDIADDLAAVARDELLPEAGLPLDFTELGGQGRLW